MARMYGTQPPLEERLRTVSTGLCTSLSQALTSALEASDADLGRGLRPVLLTSKLGLDKSLASRVVRSLGEEDPIRALHGIPTPQGLAIIAGAIREAGGDEDLVARFEGATSCYGELLSEFSGGRTDLEATLAGWIPEQRERAERDARRSVFRGMTTLSGIRTSAAYNALYLIPSDEPGRIDSLIVVVRQDLRRLRAGARLHVASLSADISGQVREALGKEVEVKDPRELLLHDLCSHPTPQLELESTGDRMTLSVDRTTLDVNEFCTIGLGWRTRGHYPKGPEDTGRPSRMQVQPKHPTEALVVDLFVHEDVELERTPWAVVTDDPRLYPADMTLPGSDDDNGGSVERYDLDEVTSHPSGLGSPDVRSCAAIAENACREAGFSVDAFRCYRGSIAFPTPVESLTVCWQTVPG